MTEEQRKRLAEIAARVMPCPDHMGAILEPTEAKWLISTLEAEAEENKSLRDRLRIVETQEAIKP